MKRYLFIFLVVFVFTRFSFADFIESTPVGPGIIHYHEFREAGPWHIHVLEIDITNDWISLETVKANNLLYGNERTSSMATRNDREEHRVVGAINGDFYNPGGIPVGAQVLNGMLLKRPYPTRSVFGYTDQKEPFINVVTFKGTIISKNDLIRAVTGVNESRATDALIVYNKYFGSTTQTNCWGGEITAEYITEGLAVNDTIFLLVISKDSISAAGHGNNSIPTNGVVLSGHSSSRDFLNENVFIGDTIKLVLQLSPITSSIKELIGGVPRIVRDGNRAVEYSAEDIAQSFCTDRHPRTAVGFSQDSTKIYFFTVDGRQSGYSVGMSLYELANYMLEWNVYQGVNLDGGGSTTMYVRGKVVNSPSDSGGERAVANALLVVSTAPTDPLALLRIGQDEVYLLSGTQLQFSASAFDQYYNPLSIEESTLNWSCEPEIGTIDSTGLFIAGSDTATGFVYVESGSICDSAIVHIIEIAKITLQPNPVILKIGEQQTIVPEARDNYENIIELSPSEYNWSVTGDMGNLSSTGVFTANQIGEGYIIANYQAIAGSTSVIVGYSVDTIIDNFSNLSNWDISGLRINLSECDLTLNDSIKYSPPTSGQINYSLTTGGTSCLYLNCSIPISGTPESISIQVYGDGKGHWLRGEFQDVDGEKFLVNFTKADSGINWVDSWKYIEVALEDAIVSWANPSAVLTFPITWKKIYLAETDESHKNSGTIYLDDFSSHFVESEIYNITRKNILEFFQLESNYPNPFNNTTNFLIILYDSGDVFLTFYDISGKEVGKIKLLNQQKGKKIVSWQPDSLSSGIYLYKIRMGRKSVFGKCLLLK